jgi:hypothetical protein
MNKTTMDKTEQTSVIQLKLKQQAKSAGGDKYQVSLSTKETFFYIPQIISRINGTAREDISLNISNTDGEIAFSLIKQGKTGDDRYTSDDQSAWKGDIYLPHIYRNTDNKIYVTVR